MTWNHRVMRLRHEKTGEEWLAIHEVYYRDDGRPCGYTEVSVGIIADLDEGIAGLRWTLDQMASALDQPILTPEDCDCGEASGKLDHRRKQIIFAPAIPRALGIWPPLDGSPLGDPAERDRWKPENEANSTREIEITAAMIEAGARVQRVILLRGMLSIWQRKFYTLR